jgi:general secretion pathway protein M
MNAYAASRKAITNSPIVSMAIYVGILVALLFIIGTSIAEVLDQRGQVASASAMLEQIEGRRPAAARGSSDDAAIPTGSAYLEGATVTIAGATLLQRVAGAVVKFGGNVLSTQLDLQGTSSRTGFISMIASCEIEQPELQQLLYDLEAGMPFLFVDQLEVQSPLAASAAGSGKLRILLVVSGQWRGAK